MQSTEKLVAFCREQNIPLCLNEPMKNYTSFKIGGNAELIIKPSSAAKLQALFVFCASEGFSPLIVGNGSNLLVCDNAIKRPIVQLGSGMGKISISGDEVACEAGTSLVKLCSFAEQNSLEGLEFAYGIPGSVGGAVYMNAGAYGGEIGNTVYSVSAVSQQGKPCIFTAQECKFSYRHSIFAENGYCVTSAIFKLKKGNREAIKAKMTELMARRSDKQPLEYPSAGSTFKRPQDGYASELIDRCGLKGKQYGGAMVSKKHAGFIINYKNATCDDVLELIRLVQDEVKQKTGVSLECEVKYIDA
ncbi:MAG: UDP-N-acetylmuramate dehydrogenase [Hydrogenoanaerobacterium sp.]